MTKDPYAPITTEGWVSTEKKAPINTEITQGDIVTVTGFPEVPMVVCTKGPHFADLIWFTADRTLQKASLPIYILVKVRSEQKVDTAKPRDKVTPESLFRKCTPSPQELTQEQFNRAVDRISRQDD